MVIPHLRFTVDSPIPDGWVKERSIVMEFFPVDWPDENTYNDNTCGYDIIIQQGNKRFWKWLYSTVKESSIGSITWADTRRARTVRVQNRNRIQSLVSTPTHGF